MLGLFSFRLSCWFCGINRDREVAPTEESRESEFPPTGKLNAPDLMSNNFSYISIWQ